MIPKVGGKQRRLGIATVRNRVVQGRVETGVGNWLRKEIRALRGSNAAAVLRKPTPIIRGWAAYYRGVAC
jgi:hypothetical protein